MRSIRILATFILSLLYISCNGRNESAGTIIPSPSPAQVQNPVKWSFSVNKVSGSEAELILKAGIDKGWHMYSLTQEKDDGPVAITFDFEKNPNYELSGKMVEPKPHQEYDKSFEMNVRFFENEVTYKQKVKLLSAESFSIKGTIQFQACIDVCVLQNKDFEFKIEGKGGTEN